MYFWLRQRDCLRHQRRQPRPAPGLCSHRRRKWIIKETNVKPVHREPWNQYKIVGQKATFKVKDIWALRVRLQALNCIRELALFNLGIDSKLRGSYLVALKMRDVSHGDQVATRAIVLQRKTQKPVQFEITAAAREAVQAWIKHAVLRPEDFLFHSSLSRPSAS